MEGHELTSSDVSSLAKSSEVKKSGKMKHSFFNEWTDEKHNEYLNTIEASFVNQLYNNHHLSADLVSWLSRTQKKTGTAQSSTNKQKLGQFKVLRRGCWEKLEFGRPMSEFVHDTKSAYQLANPWIQHFVPATVRNVSHTSVDKLEDKNNANQSILNSPTKEEVQSTKHLSDCYSVLFHQNSTKIRTGSEVLQLFPEASDQNFVDMEHESGRAGNAKKRAREAAHCPLNDQIVPSSSRSSSAPTSPSKGTRLKEVVAGHGGKVVAEQSGASCCNHKEPDGQRLGFGGGRPEMVKQEKREENA